MDVRFAKNVIPGGRFHKQFVAWAQGKTIEVSDSGCNNWRICSHDPVWDNFSDYRVAEEFSFANTTRHAFHLLSDEYKLLILKASEEGKVEYLSEGDGGFYWNKTPVIWAVYRNGVYRVRK